MKNLLLSAIVAFGMMIGIVSAQVEPDSFLVEVNPTTFIPNQAVDLTITAMKNGVVFRDYTWMVYVSVDGLRSSEYGLPNFPSGIGRYHFGVEDGGSKTFNKGLQIKKAGSFTVSAENRNRSALWSARINVSDSSSAIDGKLISIISPEPFVEVNRPMIDVYATVSDLPNADVQVYLNGVIVNQVFADLNGDVMLTLTNLREGENTVHLTVTSYTNQPLGESEKVTFFYRPITDQLLNEFIVDPSTGLRLGDRVFFDVNTDPSVTSATVILWWIQRLPLDQMADGLFSKSFAMIFTGNIPVDVELFSMGQTRYYSGIDILFVDDAPLINNVQFKIDPKTINTLTMSWSVSGTPVSGFEILYGTDKEDLSRSVSVDKPEVVFQNIDTARTYFFQIIPLLWGTREHGTATEIYTYDPISKNPDIPILTTTSGNVVVDINSWDPSSSLCSIKGIRVTTERIGGRYYLVWEAIENATSYTVYSSDTNDSTTKRKLLDTNETRYEYPFDYSSKQDIYAYFRVEATCEDGQALEITSAKMVQVGPAENILMLICLSLLIYAGIRLYRYAE